jgi:hypothetical protein
MMLAARQEPRNPGITLIKKTQFRQKPELCIIEVNLTIHLKVRYMADGAAARHSKLI